MCWVRDLGLMCSEMSKADFKSLYDEHCRRGEKNIAVWSSLFCDVSTFQLHI